jgi:hypothetical protein
MVVDSELEVTSKLTAIFKNSGGAKILSILGCIVAVGNSIFVAK